MVWTTMKFADGTYAVDWEAMQRIYRWYCASCLQMDERYARRIQQPSLLGPTLHSLDVDWPRLQADAFTAGVNRYANACAAMFSGRRGTVPAVIDELEQLQLAAAANKRKFRDKALEVSRANMASIGSTADNWGLMIDGSKIVRDACFGSITAGAMLLTGGSAAGLAMLASGSFLTGVAKFQDTDNLAAAVMSGTGALVFNAFPVKLKGAEKATLVLLKGQWEIFQGVVEGKSFLEATLYAGGKVALDEGAAAFLKNAAIKDWLGRVAVPVRTVLEHSNPAETGAKQLLTKAATPLVKLAAKSGAQAVSKTPDTKAPMKCEAGALADRCIVGAGDTTIRPIRRLRGAP